MGRTKSEGAVVEKSPSNNSIKTLHLKDRDGAAKQSAMAKAGGHSGFSSLRPYSLVSKMQQESALQIELKEQMLGYKRLEELTCFCSPCTQRLHRSAYATKKWLASRWAYFSNFLRFSSLC